MDKESVIKGLIEIGGFLVDRLGNEQARGYLRIIGNAIALMKEQDDKGDD